MENERLWGILGIVLAVASLALIGPEILHAVSTGEGGLGTTIFAVYGAGILLATLATIAVVGPSVAARASR